MSKQYIKVKTGLHRNRDISGRTFELVEEYKHTGKTGFVTVVNPEGDSPRTCRIKVDGPDAYELVSEMETPIVHIVETKQTVETDEQIIDRIRERFEILDEMTKAATNGDIRAMIVSGPPGVGKSFGVEQVIEKACLFDQIAGNRLRAEVVKGSASAIGLYSTLYKYSDHNSVIVFDDCDSILLDDTCLNLLKGALDSGKRRKISWLADSHMLRREGVPGQFEFNGSVIFLTNLKFDQMKSQKLRDHLDALQSRCHYLDLTLNTMRDKILRIKQIAKDGELFADMEMSEVEQHEVIAFMETNQERLREMSLRMAIKIAQLRKSFPNRWTHMANSTCMRHG